MEDERKKWYQEMKDERKKQYRGKRWKMRERKSTRRRDSGREK